MKAALIKDGAIANYILLPDNWTGADGEWQAPNGCEVFPIDDIVKSEAFTDSPDAIRITEAAKSTITDLMKSGNCTNEKIFMAMYESLRGKK